MVEKLVVVIMGQNCEKFIGMCLESCKSADAIVYCDGGSNDNTLKIVGCKAELITNPYDQDDLKMNGKQRNFYLNYIKENYPNDWCLALDADEVVYDLDKIKEFIQTAKAGVYSPKMRHLIGNLGWEDATQPEHFVLHRLFKIDSVCNYPEVEHPVLIPKSGAVYGATNCTTIWHLAYCPGMFDIKKRYDNHCKKSQMHSPEYLRDWYYKHLFGHYPTSAVNSIDLPHALLNYLGVDADEVYFATHRRVELKHFLLMKQWNEKFKPQDILDLGCGLGIYGYVAKAYGIPYKGIELSQYAVDANMFQVEMIQGDITKPIKEIGDLVLVLDVLEHLRYEDLFDALELISKCGCDFVFSLPYIGDPNLEADPTHIIKETRDWWIEQIGKHFDLDLTEQGWIYEHQLLVAKSKEVIK